MSLDMFGVIHVPRTVPVVDDSGDRLSHVQEAIWFSERSHDKAVNGETIFFRVAGELIVDTLREAFRLVAARHEALRRIFAETPLGLRAVVQETVADFVTVADLRGLEGQAAKSRAEELVADGCRRPFDLRTTPPIRAVVALVTEQESVIGLIVHDIVCDRRGREIILDEVGQHYRSLRTYGRPADLPEMPLDRHRPAAVGDAGSRNRVSAQAGEVASLLALCRRECGSTDLAVLLAAYAVLLSRHTGQDVVAIGTTVSHRDDESAEVVDCIDGTIPLTLRFGPETSFRDLLGQAGTGLAELARPDPWDDSGCDPAFQTTLASRWGGTLDLGDSAVCAPAVAMLHRTAEPDIEVHLREQNGRLDILAEFNSDICAAVTVERLAGHYSQLLKRLSAGIDLPIASVSFLSDEERDLILDVWNDTRADYPASTVVDMIESQAALTPDRVAAEFDGKRITYGELNNVANQIAWSLIAKLQDRSTPFVGVYMERSLELVVALLAVVKAGFAYVPLDPEHPADRIRFIVEDARLSLILTQRHRQADLQDFGAATMAVSASEGREEFSPNVTRSLSPDSPVYLIYTSGSTGQPKGVINRHVSLFNRLYWMQAEYGLTEADRVLQKTTFTFDVSVWEFFWPLMFGARIVLARPGGHKDGDYLKRLIFERAITTIHFVPSMLNVFLEEDGLARLCASLRRVICSGEALSYKTVEKFAATLTCGLHNLYGPTEAAIDVSYWTCSTGYPGQVVPIGRPIANVELYVVDAHMRLQPVGVPGELCIGGVALAAGYHDRDDLTRKAFVDNPFRYDPYARLYRTGDLARFLPDGQIQYLGRIDNQIKLRGIRIEPEEIAAALKEIPGINDAAVVLRELGTTKMLVGYVVADGIERDAIARHLEKRLPDFMIPQSIVELARLPLTPNGKLDLRALPEPATAAHTVEPTSSEEKLVAKILADVLSLAQVGVDTDFFKSGGDSISSLKVVAQLREHGYSIEVYDVFENPTVGALAKVLGSLATDAKGPAEAPFCLVTTADREMLPPGAQDAWPLTMLQSGMIFHTMHDAHTSVYRDVFHYEIFAEVHPELARRAIQSLIAGHPQLRSRFDLANFSEPLQVVFPSATAAVTVTDLRHLSRAEQDLAIERWAAGEEGRELDIERDPLVSFHIHLRSSSEMGLGLTFHHAVLDGWSVAVLLDEFRLAYGNLIAGRPAAAARETVPYSTYVSLERQAKQDTSQRMFWSGALAGYDASAWPPNSADTVEAPGSPASTGRLVPAPLTAALRNYANLAGVPVKTVYLAIHLYVLARMMRRPRVVTGLVTNGRPEFSGSEELVGLFLNTIPFPLELRQEPWHDHVRRVFEWERTASPHRRFPLAEILRLSGTDAWFDTVFNYTDFHVYDAGDRGGVTIAGARYFEQTNFAAVVHAHLDRFSKAMRLVVSYDPARLPSEQAERYADEYLRAAEELTMDPATTLSIGETAAESSLEQQVTSVVRQAVGFDGLGPDDDYRQMGVDSITTIPIVARLRRLDSSLTIADVFAHKTIRELAERIAGADASPATRKSSVAAFELTDAQEWAFPEGVVDAYPMTGMQQRMIRENARNIAQAAYHDVFSYHLATPLNEVTLRACLVRLIRGHDTLRTAFSLDGYSEPMQLVYDTAQPRLTVCDLGGFPQDQREAKLSEWLEAEKRTGFDLGEPGLIRFFAHRLDAASFVLTLSFHHSIIDGWSLSQFVRDLVAAYLASLGGAPWYPSFPKLKYRDYVRIELESRHSKPDSDFWRAKLSGYAFPPLPRAAANRQESPWNETGMVLDEPALTGLSELSGRIGTPLKYVMLASHIRTMSLIHRSPDIVTGVFANGRPEDAEGERVVGLFLNFMPLRQRIADKTWPEFIEEVYDNERLCLPHRRYPIDSIEQDLGKAPVFETCFNYTHFRAYEEIALGAGRIGVVKDVRWFEHIGGLLVNVGVSPKRGRLAITLNADAATLSQPAVDIIGRLYKTVLSELIDRPDALVTQTSADVADLLSALAALASTDI